MVSVKITTTIQKDLHDLAKQKGINWAFALQFGLRKLLNRPAELDSYATEVIEDPEKRIKKVQTVMQSTIDDLNDEIDNLKRGLK